MSISPEIEPNVFSKPQRLLNQAQFQYVFDQAPIRVSHPSLLILAKPNNNKHARLGLVIAKKQIKLAVRRNRIKRLIRESFRLRLKKLPPIDVIVLARSSADTLDNSEVTKILNGLWKRVSKKQQKLLQNQSNL
ncbi:ribonuclease P protein component [Agaribacterium sp. ZY112]|uniref:ribonuclease P protein component n=1 Tax=Agaribacterium sp. ZY112 TaxID=3233574 RepID=UPI003525608D